MEREVGGGIGMGNTCKPMAVSFQCMTKFTTIKKKKSGLSFIGLFYSNLVTISLISLLVFVIYFLLLTLGFVCSFFSSCFRRMIKLFI